MGRPDSRSRADAISDTAAAVSAGDSNPARRHAWGFGWGTVAASVIGLLVVAGLIGLIASNGGLGSNDNAGASGDAARRAVGRYAASATPAPGSSGATGGNHQEVIFGNEPAVTAPGESGADISKIIRDGTMSIEVARDGFSKAFGTIVDTHLTTILAALALWMLGSGPVRGFGVTLLIGVLISIFTAYFVSKTIFETVVLLQTTMNTGGVLVVRPPNS